MTATVDVRAPTEHEEGSRSQVLRWLKSLGEQVARDEPLMEIETDKVTVEIAAPASGVVAEILKAEREEIVPGEVLARIGTCDVAGLAAAMPPPAPAAAPLTPWRGEIATADGSLPDRAPADAHARLSPAVKRLIANLAVDPAAIRGSGAGGRLTVGDVLSYASERQRTIGPLPSASQAPRHEAAIVSRSVPHSPTRRRIAEHMVRSLLHTAPHVTSVWRTAPNIGRSSRAAVLG
jgi:2-oxoglutarate dehydrogenase E2 component (dihydrolipoamide succinyltransferase)